MKHLIFRRRRDSFTLVELLVVIAIIAILASVLISVATTAINSAKQAKANQTANSIQTAVLGYYTEYSVYPIGAATGDVYIADTSATAAGTSSGPSWQNLIEALCGNIHPSTGLAVTPSGVTNARGIPFLNMKVTDVDPANDGPLNPLPVGTEKYFNIAIDGDYDGVLGTTPPTSTVMPKFSTGTASTLTMSGGTTTAGVAVWANCNANGATNSAHWVHTY